MAGIYIHIPFCRQACHYCDFHFSTSMAMRTQIVSAICREIALQQHYLDEPVETIYFGGGTPSLLSDGEIAQIMETLFRYFQVSEKIIELTLEANPDDLTTKQLRSLKSLGINRLSIGIQSFHPAHLKYLHRTHTERQAELCVKKAQDIGINNLSIDLMYGIPAQSHALWENDLHKALALHIPHIAAYCLTIEEKTVFGKKLKNGKLTPADEQFCAQQMQIGMQQLENANYQHYEISNFARSAAYARHNTAYWQQVPYLGVGPSAHSYNTKTRQYNISNNQRYLQAIHSGTIPAEREVLSPQNHINEYIMTSLRTIWGCRNELLRSQYHYDLLQKQQETIKLYSKKACLRVVDDVLYLTRSGKLIADKIAADLFVFSHLSN